MRTKFTTALLLLVLTMATVAMGLTFDYGGLGGIGGGGGGGGVTSASTTGRVPHLVVIAYSAQPTTPLPPDGSGQNQSILAPMVGLRFTLTATDVELSRLGRPLTYYVFTNSSGAADIAVAAGNYSIQAASPQFNFTRPMTFKGNLTTELVLVVTPVYTNVLSLSVVNPDQVTGLEPSTAIYAQIPGPFHYDKYSLYQLRGTGPWTFQQSGTPGVVIVNFATLITVNATVSGFYDSPVGTMVVLSPTGPYGQLPVSGIQLLQYVANSTVRFIGG